MKFIFFIFAIMSASLHAVEGGVFRFWTNDGDVEDGRINGLEDRENFFPMLLDLRQFVDAWYGKGVSFRLRGNGALNIAFTSMSRNDVWALYRSDEVLSGESVDHLLDSAHLVQITPQGIDIAGTPAMFIDTVQISAKYISKGLFDLAPISNATIGDVGVINTSYFSKALSNSFFTNVLTCCAFL